MFDVAAPVGSLTAASRQLPLLAQPAPLSLIALIPVLPLLPLLALAVTRS